MHAFTATATEQVRRDIVERLGAARRGDAGRRLRPPEPDLPRRARVPRDRQVEEVLRGHRGEAGIIYCTSRKDVDALAATLAAAGHRAVPYHAGLPDAERAQQSGRVHQRARRHRRRDRRLRHGHRPARRPLRPARRRAEVARALSAGGGPRRPRRPRSRVRAALLVGRLPEVAAHARDRRRAERRRRSGTCATWSAYAVRMRCRHRALVEHFGQRYERADCGACDWCLRELEASRRRGRSWRRRLDPAWSGSSSAGASAT